MKEKILWIDNMKVLGLLGIMTYHFWPQEDVILCHIAGLQVAKLPVDNGFQGTFLFFIASGLGLTLSQGKRALTLHAFLWSRFRRLYGPYWLTLLMIFFLVRAGFNVYSTNPQSSIELMTNIFLLQVDTIPKVQPHLWFLFTLVQMYLFFPFLFQLGTWSKNAGMVLVIALFLWRVKIITLAPAFLNHGTFIWLFPFYLGMYGGFCLIQNQSGTEQIMAKIFPLGLVVWLGGTFAYQQPQYRTISFIPISFGLLITTYWIARYNWRTGFVNKFLYEIYLVHVTILAMSNFYLSKYPLLFRYIPFLLCSLITGILLHTLNRSAYRAVGWLLSKKIFFCQFGRLP